MPKNIFKNSIINLINKKMLKTWIVYLHKMNLTKKVFKMN